MKLHWHLLEKSTNGLLACPRGIALIRMTLNPQPDLAQLADQRHSRSPPNAFAPDICRSLTVLIVLICVDWGQHLSTASKSLCRYILRHFGWEFFPRHLPSHMFASSVPGKEPSLDHVCRAGLQCLTPRVGHRAKTKSDRKIWPDPFSSRLLIVKGPGYVPSRWPCHWGGFLPNGMDDVDVFSWFWWPLNSHVWLITHLPHFDCEEKGEIQPTSGTWCRPVELLLSKKKPWINLNLEEFFLGIFFLPFFRMQPCKQMDEDPGDGRGLICSRRDPSSFWAVIPCSS